MEMGSWPQFEKDESFRCNGVCIFLRHSATWQDLLIVYLTQSGKKENLANCQLQKRKNLPIITSLREVVTRYTTASTEVRPWVGGLSTGGSTK